MEDRIESLVLVTTKSVRNLFAISSLESKFAHVCWFKDSTTKTQRKPQHPRWQERGGGVITFVFRTQGILKSIGSIIVLRHAAPGSRVLDMVLWSGASYRRFCVCVCVCVARERGCSHLVFFFAVAGWKAPLHAALVYVNSLGGLLSTFKR